MELQRRDSVHHYAIEAEVIPTFDVANVGIPVLELGSLLAPGLPFAIASGCTKSAFRFNTLRLDGRLGRLAIRHCIVRGERCANRCPARSSFPGASSVTRAADGNITRAAVADARRSRLAIASSGCSSATRRARRTIHVGRVVRSVRTAAETSNCCDRTEDTQSFNRVPHKTFKL